MKKGITFIEILLVVIIFGLIISFSSFWFSNFSRGDFILEESVSLVVSVLKLAKEKATIGEENSAWGVYLVNNSTTSDYIYLLNNTSSIKEAFNLPVEATFYDFATKEIYFKKLTGETTSTQIKIGMINENKYRLILIPTSGAFIITSSLP